MTAPAGHAERGRTALVTGAASGIGLALSRALVADGWFVVVTDLDGAGAERVASELAAAGGPPRARAERLDVTDGPAVTALVGAVDGDRGLDLMINNAGFGVGGPFEALTAEHWRRQLEVNLYGVVHGALAAYPLMKARGHGQILNTASMAGLVGAPGLSPYATSKFAVVGLTRALRAEAAVHGVKVSALCPSFVDTPLLDMDNPADLSVGDAFSGGIRSHLPAFGMGKLATAESVAATALRGLRKNKAVIVAPASARVAYAATRYLPRVADLMTNRAGGKLAASAAFASSGAASAAVPMSAVGARD